jgi:Flp pilus assembly protein TadG
MKKTLKLARSDAGTSLIEFALLAPVLIFLLIGLIEVGRYTYFAILASNAARAGVAYGAQNAITAFDATGIQSAALQDAQNITGFSVAPPNVFCSTDGVTVSACPSGTGPTPPLYYYVQVSVTGTFSSLLNYPGIPNHIPISGSAVMRVVSPQ